MPFRYCLFLSQNSDISGFVTNLTLFSEDLLDRLEDAPEHGDVDLDAEGPHSPDDGTGDVMEYLLR